MADTCDYGSLREDLIRDRLVVGLPDKKLSGKLQLDARLKFLSELGRGSQPDRQHDDNFAAFQVPVSVPPVDTCTPAAVSSTEVNCPCIEGLNRSPTSSTASTPPVPPIRADFDALLASGHGSFPAMKYLNFFIFVLQLHWVSFDASNDTIRRAFEEHGEVKEVSYDWWKVPGFIGVATTRIVRLVLPQGVPLDRINCASAAARLPWLCRGGPRFASGAAGGGIFVAIFELPERGTADGQSEFLMDQEEVEKAATSSVSATEETGQNDKSGTVSTKVSDAGSLQELTVAPVQAVERPSAEAGDPNAASVAPAYDGENPATENPVAEMDIEASSVKRRHDDVVEASQGKRQQQL
ncbi:hypothetical protein ISCGN_014138 [Ixodes scapularis]